MLDGRRLRVGRPFKTADGVSYSQLWAEQLTAEEKTALGITYEADPAPFDSKYYFSAGNPRQLDNGTDDAKSSTKPRSPSSTSRKKAGTSKTSSTAGGRSTKRPSKSSKQ